MMSLVTSSVTTWAVDSDDQWYLGAGFGAFTYQQNNLSDFNLEQHYLFVGKQLNHYLSAEVHLGNSGSDTVQLSGIPVKLNVDNFVSGFVKAKLTLSPQDWGSKRLRLYGLLGGTRIKTTSSDPAYTQSGVQTSISAGAGLELQIDNMAVQFGYTQYVSGSANSRNYTLDSLHIGITYLFGDEQVDDAK